MTNPIYDALVIEQQFNPFSLPPNQTRAERAREHDIWWQQTLEKATVKVKPVKKVARGKRGAA